MMLHKLNFYIDKNVIWPLLYATHKVNFTGIADLKVKDKTIKLLEGNIGEYLDFSWNGKDVFKKSQKVLIVKQKLTI